MNKMVDGYRIYEQDMRLLFVRCKRVVNDTQLRFGYRHMGRRTYVIFCVGVVVVPYDADDHFTKKC
ncbi:hypothetical protein DERF_010570 [Dermatophagoides farinae]|uniref:Uncharacterized protein n=1 Tax=Dermatophagoides farinae TaxID=6954 RepID=A0A922L292_DERFA|nr:hypothetical protein DERF_010570 [Dermatophagoides farinae]